MPGPSALTLWRPHICVLTDKLTDSVVFVLLCVLSTAPQAKSVWLRRWPSSLRLSEACTGAMRVGGNINSAQEDQPFALRMSVLEEVWYTGGRQGRQEVRGCVLFQPQPLLPLPLSNMCICVSALFSSMVSSLET